MEEKLKLTRAVDNELSWFIKICGKTKSYKERLEYLAKALVRILKLLYFYWKRKRRPEV